MQSTFLEPRTAPAPTEVPLTVEERVRNGAAFLDERVPGWRERVDPDELAIQQCDYCVLGQVFGSVADGCASLALYDGSVGRLQRLGFYWYNGEGLAALNTAWRRELGCPA